MKTTRNTTSVLEIASGMIIVLYAAALLRADSGLPYLGPALGLGVLMITIGALTFVARGGLMTVLKTVFAVLFYALFISYLAFLVFVLSGMLSRTPEKLDYLIVPGAAVNGDKPSDALKLRIDRAAEYLEKNPETVCIATGAVEEDGEISEAECISRGIVEKGISQDRIIREELATTTVENMKNSAVFIEGASSGVGVATNGFHVARSVMIMKNFTEFPVYGCPANGLTAYTPYNVTREFVVFIIDLCEGNFQIKF